MRGVDEGGYGAISDAQEGKHSTIAGLIHHSAKPKDSMKQYQRRSESDHGVYVKRRSRLDSLEEQASLIPSASLKGSSEEQGEQGNFVYILVYAIVNSVMCVPCLFGYAAVIFNNNAFQPHISALSKLVVWSSVIHQCSFTMFSTLPFAIGQVQDAGLIFLSSMANTIAYAILDDGGTVEEAVSTTIVLLTLATASLGLILVAMGRYGLADAVSYIPLPVIGGYLAFIGYFCIQQGVALCISEAMMGLGDWSKIFNTKAFILALPGILAGLILAWISRKVENDAALPLTMVALLIGFYVILMLFDVTLEESREAGWVGEVAPPVPVTELFQLIDFGNVRWGLVSSIWSTWVGMVFVVSFSSCLDVAAISMDMGEALNVNMELVTVGLSNFLSGISVGFTGSYIFSQTIFTYRTGTSSRWVGILVAVSEIAVVVSTVNLLQVVPLFFLGCTLIFIGFDLVFEWIFEVRHRLLLMEYIILLFTFVAIQFVGIDAGIVLGIVVAVVDYVVTTAKISSVTRVSKMSRAVWRPDEWKTLQKYGYHMQHPQIMTLEVTGTVFFGNSLQLLSSISNEIGINASEDDMRELSLQSPRIHRANSRATPPTFSPRRTSRRLEMIKEARSEHGKPASSSGKLESRISAHRSPPRFVVLDVSSVSNVDASAARGCFLQLAKMCARYNIILCVAGANARVDWMLRSHDIAYKVEEEDKMLTSLSEGRISKTERVLIFVTLYEALEFCEGKLISQVDGGSDTSFPQPLQQGKLIPPSSAIREEKMSLSSVFVRILGLKDSDTKLLEAFECEARSFHDEISYHSGQVIFESGTAADSFFVILSGAVALCGEDRAESSESIISGAGSVSGLSRRKTTSLGEIGTILRVGSVFGFVSFILELPWSFSAVASEDRTVVAKLHRKGLDELKSEPALEHIVDKVLLKASILELANVSEL